jgi:hypothetical protein
MLQSNGLMLERFPTCRNAADSPFLRELIIPFGATGCAALFGESDGPGVKSALQTPGPSGG